MSKPPKKWNPDASVGISYRYGNIHALWPSVLTEDIAFYADGGSTLKVFKKISTGIHEVADTLIFVFHKYDTGYTVKAGEINHQPALLFYDGDQLKICQVFGIDPETNRIFQISNVLDPEKLKSIGSGLA